MFKFLKRNDGFYKSLLLLAIPIILQNVISQSVAMTDTFMLGFVGQEEMSAVTLANSAFFVLSIIIFGFQSGESVMISQYWGKGDKKAISKILGVAWMCVLSITTVFAIFAMISPETVMRIFSNDAETITLGAQYVRMVAIAYPLNAFTSIYISAHRSMENTKLGLFVFAISAIANTLLNYMFIFGHFGAPQMGVVGAAVGTVAARIIETVIIVLYIIYNKRFRLNIKAALKPGVALVRDFIRYAVPVITNETLWGVGFSSLSAIYGRIGSDVVAAMTISRNIESLFNVVAFAVANAAVVLIGKQLGKGEIKEVYGTGKILVFLAACSGALSAIFIFVIARPVINIFALPDATKALAYGALMIYLLRMIPMNINATLIVGVLRGGGDTRMAMLIDTMPLWLVNVPLSLILGLVLKVPPIYVFLPGLLEDTIKMIVGMKRFKSRLWINNITREVL